MKLAREKMVDGAMDAAYWATEPFFAGLGQTQRILDAKKAGQTAIAVRKTDRYRLLFRAWVHFLLREQSEQADQKPGIDVYYGSERSPLKALKDRALAALKRENSLYEAKSRRKMPLSFFFNFRVYLREKWENLPPHFKSELIRFLKEQEGSDFLDFTCSPILEQAWRSPTS